MIHIKSFQKRYKHHRISFKDLRFQKGINIVLGQNGVGKSTLLKGLAGINHAQIEGDVPKDFLYVEAAPFLPALMRAQDYLVCIQKMGKYEGFALEDLMVKFDINMHRHKRIFQLSKGMRQKLYLMTALMEKRTLYLYDEPFEALDDQTVMTLIELWRQQDAYIIATTHDLRHVKKRWVIRL